MANNFQHGFISLDQVREYWLCLKNLKVGDKVSFYTNSMDFAWTSGRTRYVKSGPEVIAVFNPGWMCEAYTSDMVLPYIILGSRYSYACFRPIEDWSVGVRDEIQKAIEENNLQYKFFTPIHSDRIFIANITKRAINV